MTIAGSQSNGILSPGLLWVFAPPPPVGAATGFGFEWFPSARSTATTTATNSSVRKTRIILTVRCLRFFCDATVSSRVVRTTHAATGKQMMKSASTASRTNSQISCELSPCVPPLPAGA